MGILVRMITCVTPLSQAAKRMNLHLKEKKGLSKAYRKTLKILGEVTPCVRFVECGTTTPPPLL
jgi:hypothetical protein